MVGGRGQCGCCSSPGVRVYACLSDDRTVGTELTRWRHRRDPLRAGYARSKIRIAPDASSDDFHFGFPGRRARCPEYSEQGLRLGPAVVSKIARCLLPAPWRPLSRWDPPQLVLVDWNPVRRKRSSQSLASGIEPLRSAGESRSRRLYTRTTWATAFWRWILAWRAPDLACSL